MSSAYMQSPLRKGLTRTVSITSGKGGVGKTTLISNMAYHLGQQGARVLILDGDLGMANVDIMFGVRPKVGIDGVLRGERSIGETIVEVEDNVHLIPGGSGIYGLQRLNIMEKRFLLDQVSQLEMSYDFMLIDTAPGIDDNVLYLNSAAQETVVVVTPDPSSIADAYALIKVLNQRHRENNFSVVCNLVRDEAEALKVFKGLSDVAARFLCVGLDFKGFIPFDRDLRKATKSQQLVVKSAPRCPSSFAIKRVAENFNGYGHIGAIKGGMQFFWEQLVGVA